MTSMEVVNIASHLPKMAAQLPHRPAVLFPHGRDRSGRVAYTHLTFAQLNQDSDRIALGLRKLGIERGARTALLVKPSLDFFALTFGLFKAGIVPVLIDPGIGFRNFGNCLAEAEPEAFIGIPPAQAARIVLGWSKRTIRRVVTVGRKLGWSGPDLDEVRALGAVEDRTMLEPTTAEETAAILFTSGSTGPPKGAVYTHGIFDAQVRLLKVVYGIEPGEMDLPTFPLFALFGPALGMTAVIPNMDFTRPARINPERVREAIEDFGITNMFGSPALVDRVGRYGVEHGWRFPTLRRVISAGAPVPARVLERFSQLLEPPAEIHTPFGATESLPVASIGSSTILADTRFRTEEGAGVCVGYPVAEMTVRILRISDDPIEDWSGAEVLPDGEIGEIAVHGPVVTREYFHRAESTRLAKIHDSVTGAIWHRMGDVGYFDAAGRLWFCGRKAHRVITVDGTLFTIPVEGVFNTHPKVFRTALVGVAGKPVLCVELEPGAKDAPRERIQDELRAIGRRHTHTAGVQTFLFHPAFPVDIRHNAKIFREKLAVWAARQLG